MSLLVSLGWNKCDTRVSSIRRSVTLGDPGTCMDIIIFLLCHVDNDFGRKMLSLYKIDIPWGEGNLTQSKGKDGETDVDHASTIRNGIDFLLGPKHQLNIRFRRVSKFVREVLQIHKVYLQESQFVRQVCCGMSIQQPQSISCITDYISTGICQQKTRYDF